LSAQFLIAYFVLTAAAVFFANQLAIAKRRSATGWMWATALFPPSVLLPAPRRSRGAATEAAI